MRRGGSDTDTHRGIPCEATETTQPSECKERGPRRDPAHPFVPDFWFPELRGNKHLVFKPPDLWRLSQTPWQTDPHADTYKFILYFPLKPSSASCVWSLGLSQRRAPELLRVGHRVPSHVPHLPHLSSSLLVMRDAPGSLSIFRTLGLKAAISPESEGSFSLTAFRNRDLGDGVLTFGPCPGFHFLWLCGNSSSGARLPP